MNFPDSCVKANPYLSSIWISLSARLRRSWGFPLVPTVDLHTLPSFVVLCQSANFVRERADFLDWLALQHIREIEFSVHQVLVYHVSGTGTEHILYFVWMDFRGYSLSYLVATLSLPGVARLFREGLRNLQTLMIRKSMGKEGEMATYRHRKPVSIQIDSNQERIKLLSWPNWTDTWIYEQERCYSWIVTLGDRFHADVD